MSCVLITPPEYEPDSGVSPPPYIVSSSADPTFESSVSYNDLDSPTFKVTVGDADVAQKLEVRLCLRETADSSSPFLFVTKQFADPTPDHQADRKPVVAQNIPVCNRWAANNTVHFLYVVVTDGTFRLDNLGCDVTPGSSSDTAFWRFTCDKPQ